MYPLCLCICIHCSTQAITAILSTTIYSILDKIENEERIFECYRAFIATSIHTWSMLTTSEIIFKSNVSLCFETIEMCMPNDRFRARPTHQFLILFHFTCVWVCTRARAFVFRYFLRYDCIDSMTWYTYVCTPYTEEFNKLKVEETTTTDTLIRRHTLHMQFNR